MTNKNARLTPIFIAIALVVGIGIGAFYTDRFGGNRLGIVNSSSNKLNALLRIINDKYMDEVSTDSIVEMAMPLLLRELDPHSNYMPAGAFSAFNEELEGKFSGVGLSFSIHNDTAVVNKVIAGGPSAKLGIRPGDRILRVNDSIFTGKHVTNEYVLEHLRGKKGTKVRLTLKQRGKKAPLNVVVTRGEIPLNSIKASYMMDKVTGYVCVESFGRTTHVEMLNALAILSAHGMKRLVVDLRSNTGGMMESAVLIANEFLGKNELIVYTEGRNYPRQESRADGNGSFQKLPLVLLMDEFSASASEILAGAMQDNDRAMIVGRRSFGKGLVQQPIAFSDGSAIRLTIARYHTPSGRCIQRPYTNDSEYEWDLMNRYNRGEFTQKDSIHLDTTTTYYTLHKRRPVYAGGGIMPDIFVPMDTLGQTSWYLSVKRLYLPEQFSFDFLDTRRDRLARYSTPDDLVAYLKRIGLVEQFVEYAARNGVRRRNLLIQQSEKLIEDRLFAQIIYMLLGESEMYQYLNKTDKTVAKALETFEAKSSSPSASR